jgi:hypothetical protein
MHKQDVENSLDGTVGGITCTESEELEPTAVAGAVKVKRVGVEPASLSPTRLHARMPPPARL